MSLAETWRRARRGPWRVAVAEESMVPAIRPGDWLLTDPTVQHWPRRGSVVVVHQPGTGRLVIKRLAAGPADVVAGSDGYVALANEAWLLGDAPDRSVDSRRYGAVPLSALVARAWFRFWPPRRMGRIPRPANEPDRDRRTATGGPAATAGG